MSNIRPIVIGNDQSLLNEGSAVRARLEHYAQFTGGIDVILFCKKGSESKVFDNDVRVFPIYSKCKIISVIKALKTIKKNARPESIITVQDPFELGLIGLIASKLTGIPLHVQVHIDFFSPHFKAESIRQRIQTWIGPFVLRRAASIRAVSEKITKYLRDDLKIPAHKIITTPVFVNVEKIRHAPITTDLHKKYPVHRKIVLMGSRLVKQKNIPLAIEAFSRLCVSNETNLVGHYNLSDAGLVIIGSGPEEARIRKEISDRNMTEHIHLEPWSNDMSSLMKTCDLFLLSSDYEGWGMTIVEAAACGKPIVMTDVGCAGEFLINEESGLVVPVRDPDSMEMVMRRVLSDERLARKLGESAKEAAQKIVRAENDDKIIHSWQLARKHI